MESKWVDGNAVTSKSSLMEGAVGKKKKRESATAALDDYYYILQIT